MAERLFDQHRALALSNPRGGAAVPQIVHDPTSWELGPFGCTDHSPAERVHPVPGAVVAPGQGVMEYVLRPAPMVGGEAVCCEMLA